MPDNLPHPARRSHAVHLAGSTTMAPHIRHLAEAHMAAQAGRAIVVVEGTSTARGCKALQDGTADIAMVSGPMPEGVAVGRTVVVGNDPVAIVVHAANPVDALDALALADIFAGRIVNWRDVGGPDLAIAPLVGFPGGGVTATIGRMIGPDSGFAPSRRVLQTADRLRTAAADRAAITYATGPLPAGLRLKAVAIDGRTSGMAGYPLRVAVMLAAARGAAAAVQGFIDYAAAHWHGTAATGEHGA